MTVEEATTVIAKQQEQIVALENQLRRLPSDASEVAEVQAAIYSIISGEAEELLQVIELEKRQFEDFRRAHEERQEKLMERRRELLKRGGVNIEDMTRRALMNRPDDPRLTLLRDEYARYRESTERQLKMNAAAMAEKDEQLQRLSRDATRHAAARQDLSQYMAEIARLKEELAKREQDLTSVHHELDEERKRQAFQQQELTARLARFEPDDVGGAAAPISNQTREARQVKLPSWMKLSK